MNRSWPFGDLIPLSFDFAMIDFPWPFETYSDKGQEKGPESYYETMSIEEICELPVGQLFGRDGLALIWMTHPMIDRQMKVLPAFGMRFLTSGVWVKRGRSGKLAFGSGYWLRCASEPFVLAAVGNPEVKSRSIRTVIEGPARGHSVKPNEAYAMAEKMWPNGRYLDLFSRKTRPGWTAWGNQTGLLDNQARAPKREQTPVMACNQPAEFFGELLP